MVWEKKNLHVTHKISSKNMQDRNHLEIRLFPQMPQHNIQILTLIKETLSQTVHVLNCLFILAKEGIVSLVCSFIAKGKQICHN